MRLIYACSLDCIHQSSNGTRQIAACKRTLMQANYKNPVKSDVECLRPSSGVGLFMRRRAFFKDFPVGGGGHFLKKDLSQAFCEILK